MNFGTTEILLIVAVLFLLFGATRLPQLAKSLGQSRKAFKDGMREAEEEEAADRAKIKAAPPDKPQITQIGEAEIEDELKRRSEAQAEH